MTSPVSPAFDSSGVPPSAVTQLIQAHADGDRDALERLIPLIYDDLKRIAHRHLQRESAGHTLCTTAVVHEGYAQLADGGKWRDRAHFFAVASRVMRHVLIDHARSRSARKRGGERIQVPLRAETASVPAEVVDLLELDDALVRLSAHDERMARVVEYRFFGGMTSEETAEVLGCSLRTVERLWARARAYLYQLLRSDADERTNERTREL